MKTIRLTVAQALLRFLDNQYVCIDEKELKFVSGVLGVLGHGNALGVGEAIQNSPSSLKFTEALHEQGMVHTATAFAKANNRLKIMACTSSLGPGAMNMLGGAAVATTNRIPVLLLPSDTFACRQPDPVLQQLELPHDYQQSVNDCFKPVSRYWDRINLPEQLMAALINAVRVLTCPIETGAVTICLPQDIQAKAYDYPLSFFKKRVHHIDRRMLSKRALNVAVSKIRRAKKPVIVAGGGVHYSLATSTLSKFISHFGIPVVFTAAGKGAIPSDNHFCLDGVGVNGNIAANKITKEADLILAIGTRLSDFTTASKTIFDKKAEILALNVNTMDAYKMDAHVLLGDARAGLVRIHNELDKHGYLTDKDYQRHVADLKTSWELERSAWYKQDVKGGNSKTTVLGVLNNFVSPHDYIVAASGSISGLLHYLWSTRGPNTYHVENAFACMGYEIAGGLGVKLANPNKEIYVLVDNNSFFMLHAEIVSSININYKIIVIVLNNQLGNDSKKLQNNYMHRNFINKNTSAIDFTALSRSLGAKAFFAKDIMSFEGALLAAKQEKISTVIEIKVLADKLDYNNDAWWRVDVAETSSNSYVREFGRSVISNLNTAYPY